MVGFLSLKTQLVLCFVKTKGLIMEMTINYMDCVLDCEFDYEDADHSVGYNGCVMLHSACINGQNICEMISEKHIEGIEQEIFERM